MPTTDTVPHPFMQDMPAAGAGMGIVQAFGRKPGLIDMNKDQNNYHLSQSEWTLTEKVVLAEWGAGLDYEKHLSPGDIVFLSPSQPQPVQAIGDEKYPLLNVACAQDLLKRIWRTINTRVVPYLDGAGVAGDADELDEDYARSRAARDDAARIPRFAPLLKLPEVNMRELFGPKSELGGKTDAIFTFRWMSVDGVLDQLRPFGVIMNDPTAAYGQVSQAARRTPSEARLIRNMVSVGTSGTVDVYNYWPAAEHNDWLFIVIRRRYDENSQAEAGFEISFPFRRERHLPTFGQKYMGMAQLPQNPGVYYFGQYVRKLPGGPAVPPDMAGIATGRTNTTIEESINLVRNCGKIRVTMAPLMRRT